MTSTKSITNNSGKGASSAAGTGLVCPTTLIPASHADARQSSAVRGELAALRSHRADRDGVSVVNRRAMMNMMLGTAIAGAAISSNPTATVAAPLNADRRALEAYASWLHMERRLLCLELYPHMGHLAERFVFGDNAGYDWHFSGRGSLNWDEGPQPSARAAMVLDTVGVDWRRYEPEMDNSDNGQRPLLPANWPEIDGELRKAFEDLVAADAEIAKLHTTYGDDADSREEYLTAEEKRNNSIETLITVPASSMVGIQAKASALRLKVMFEDFESHQQIAVSLADDLACLGPRSIAQIPDAAALA